MKKLKATNKEKIMDSIIGNIRRPYNYKITKDKLEEAARETRYYFAKLRDKTKYDEN